MTEQATDPEWWKRAVFYQIYPRSFSDADGDGIGDLKGITAKLDYIASLGVDAIWLSPVFTSPMKDFGYDVSDYRGIDPLFGTIEDFDALLAGAHERELKLIIDQVWSHTSDQHPWFVESASSTDNDKADWYVWADAKPDGTAPNNWMAVFGGPSWTWHPRRRQYYLHNFLIEQPDLNFWNPAVQDAILDVAHFWLDRGVDGFRLDVINFLFHDRRLIDNPSAALNMPAAQATDFQRHIHDRSQPETLVFLGRLRALLDSYGDRVTLGEIGDADMLGRQIEYTATATRLHTAYSFYFLNARDPTPELFAGAMAAWAEAEGWPSWSFSNHDFIRFPTRMAHSGDPAQAKGLLALLLSLRGTPFLYEGDELGLPHAEVPFERLRDPFARAIYTGESGRDGARTPMPWTNEPPNAGFSSAAETWLPVDPRHLPLAVAEQEGDAGSMLRFTRAMLGLRRRSPALRAGDFRLLDADPGVLAFERRLEDERVLCAFELSGQPGRVRHPEMAGSPALALIGGAMATDTSVELPPFAFAWVRLGRLDSGAG
ncbi:MAG TPA: alpha-glucosidase family protein [Caulobacteraceae bacterium]|nr:alpha-glucosidase family protein [Caulobacteraceae bacterium]